MVFTKERIRCLLREKVEVEDHFSGDGFVYKQMKDPVVETQGRARGKRPGPWPPSIEPFMAPAVDRNPRDLKTWAKRTGFNPSFSGETMSVCSEIESGPSRWDALRRPEIEGVQTFESPSQAALSPVDPLLPPPPPVGSVGDRALPQPPVSSLGERRTPLPVSSLRDRPRPISSLRDTPAETRRETDLMTPVRSPPPFPVEEALPKSKIEVSPHRVGGIRAGDGRNGTSNVIAKEDPHSVAVELPVSPPVTSPDRIPAYQGRPVVRKASGFASFCFYGVQHYLSLTGSLVFIPLVMVPIMGGTDEETAMVVSTVLLVTGVTTLLHSYLGTRLPLVQGSSFVYLAPALAIANSQEFRNLSENKFKHIMKELQGAIIVGSIFQCFSGYSGLMSLFLRLINPVVVAPTIAAVGFAFFSYEFTQAATCIEISIPQLLLIVLFTLYLRRFSIYGHRIFQVYAVPLGLAITWVYASVLTASGAYNFKNCNLNIPSSNMLSQTCRKHAMVMKQCRTDVSDAWRSSAWLRVPYPFQWGVPSFRLRTSIIMVVVSIIASIDSVGSYHASSLLVNSRTPTPGIVSRGIGLEGFTSILAGFWGTGTGSTTLTENVHTIATTKMGSQRAVQFGAILLIVCSFMGKIGAVIASIPPAMAATVLCFMWGMTVALGLSTLRYSEGSSSRNVIIVGLSLFLAVSVPSYFQQYGSNINIILPNYISAYNALSDGPIHTGSKDIDFALNGLLSLHMVVAFLVAFVLDNSVPGSKQERGVYIWSKNSDANSDPNLASEYALPSRISRCFRWAKWVGI